MIRSFSTFSLGADDIGVVFPLVQAVLPGIDLAAWRRFARPLVDRQPPSPCGAIGLRNAADYVCGILTYRAERNLRCGTVLNIDLFTTLDLVSEDSATQALLLAAEVKARELDCAAMHIHLEKAQKSATRCLGDAGFRLETSRYCKTVSVAPPPS